MNKYEIEIAEINARMARNCEKAEAEIDAMRKEADAKLIKIEAEIAAMRAETEKTRAETEKNRKESDDRIAAMRAETEKTRAETEALRKENEIARKENEAAEMELKKKFKSMNTDIAGITKGQGQLAETIFFEHLDNSQRFAGLYFDTVDSNQKRRANAPDGIRIGGQFDIIMKNGTAVALIEVKHKAEQSDVIDLVTRKIRNFQILFPEYSNHKIYLGLAALIFDQKAEEEIQKHNVGMLKLNGEMVEVVDQGLAPFICAK
jgi:hypothetical protein